MNLNTLTDFPFSKRYYLTHPWKWVKHLCVNIRSAWMRATKGYCYSDVWNWDSWFCSITPLMLRHIANYGSAYPGQAPFDTPEKWHNWLCEMANKIEHIQCDTWYDDNNEYAEEYHQSFEEEYSNGPNITTTWTNRPPREEIRKLYYEKCKLLTETRQQAVEKVFKDLSEGFDSIWD